MGQLFIKVLNEDIFSSLSKIDNINNKIKVIIIESLSHEINQSIKKFNTNRKMSLNANFNRYNSTDKEETENE